VTTTPGYDEPPPFCVCGHDLTTHPQRPCPATLPDRCTCQGGREARRSRDVQAERVHRVAAERSQ
jgi:hypothetical protein